MGLFQYVVNAGGPRALPAPSPAPWPHPAPLQDTPWSLSPPCPPQSRYLVADHSQGHFELCLFQNRLRCNKTWCLQQAGGTPRPPWDLCPPPRALLSQGLTPGEGNTGGGCRGGAGDSEGSSTSRGSPAGNRTVRAQLSLSCVPTGVMPRDWRWHNPAGLAPDLPPPSCISRGRARWR